MLSLLKATNNIGLWSLESLYYKSVFWLHNFIEAVLWLEWHPAAYISELETATEELLGVWAAAGVVNQADDRQLL